MSGYGTMPSDDAPVRQDSHFKMDPKEYHESLYGISSASVHNKFIVKVYSLLAVELLFCAGVCALFTLTPALRNWIVSFQFNNSMLFNILLIIFLVGSSCWLKAVQRYYPLNMYALATFVFFVSIDVASLTAVFYINGEGSAILIAIGITAVIFFALTAYAWMCEITEAEFSYMLAFCIIATFALILLLIINCFVQSSTMQIVLAAVGVIIFSVWILVDTYMIKTKLGPDDAIAASVELFMDIINIFIFVLEILGSR
jgi:FtsH-binding integral membrane protein